MITVRASRYYRRWLAGAREVQIVVDGPILLSDLLLRLSEEWPDFARLPIDDRARLQGEVLVFGSGRFIRVDDTVAPGEGIELLPPMSGG